jgi:nicotinate-nucleotide adenylyltransferase
MGRLRTKRIGVMGGTFDPIHLGHLAAAQEALEQFTLDEVIFVPAARSPFKQEEEGRNAEKRYLMTVIATASNPRFQVSRLELDRTGLSYTVDTMRELRKIHGPRSEFFFIGGTDTIMELGDWKEPEALLELCVFIAVERPGFEADKVRKSLSASERKRFTSNPRIVSMKMQGMDISSTEVRQRVRDGRSIRYMVPWEVVGFIEKNGLYRGR